MATQQSSMAESTRTIISPITESSMSNSLNDRPPPRRKSCTACIRTKRRCDILYNGSGACSRCIKKGLQCEGLEGTRSRHASVDPVIGEVYAIPAAEMTSTTEQSRLASTSMEMVDYTYDNMPAQVPTAFSTIPDRWPSGVAPGMPDWNTTFPVQATLGLPQEDIYIPDESSHTHNAPGVRISYAVEWMKSLPQAFSERNKTPFLHPTVFLRHVPRSTANVFVACTLHCSKTSQNRRLIRSIIDDKITDLLTTNFATLGRVESLACVQALLLYQIIRVFDTNVAQRTQADANMHILRSWTIALAGIRDQAEFPMFTGMHDASSVPEPWEGWAFQESVRRTVIISNYFLCLHSIIRYNEDASDEQLDQLFLDCLGPEASNTLSPWVTTNAWTLSRRAWDAESAEAFRTAWRHHPPYSICNIFLEDFLKHGSGEDVDHFSRLLISTYMGYYNAAGWLKQ